MANLSPGVSGAFRLRSRSALGPAHPVRPGLLGMRGEKRQVVPPGLQDRGQVHRQGRRSLLRHFGQRLQAFGGVRLPRPVCARRAGLRVVRCGLQSVDRMRHPRLLLGDRRALRRRHQRGLHVHRRLQEGRSLYRRRRAMRAARGRLRQGAGVRAVRQVLGAGRPVRHLVDRRLRAGTDLPGARLLHVFEGAVPSDGLRRLQEDTRLPCQRSVHICGDGPEPRTTARRLSGRLER